MEKFFKKEASSEERRILIEWIRKPGIRDEFNSLCEQMWKEAAVEIDKTVEEEMWNHLQRNLDEPKILYPKKRRWQPIIYKVAEKGKSAVPEGLPWVISFAPGSRPL